MMKFSFWFAAVVVSGANAQAADLSGHQLLVTSVRTGDTEVFVADPTTGDLFNVTRSPQSEDRYPCWSPDGKQICFMSDREGTTNLWISNADGSNVRRLNRTPDVWRLTAVARAGGRPPVRAGDRHRPQDVKVDEFKAVPASMT